MIAEATPSRIMHVAKNMRADDAREIFANCWSDDPQAFAFDCMRLPGAKLCCLDSDGMPVSVGGIANHIPGVGQAWLIGTDDIGKHGAEIAHACKKLMRRLFEDGGLHRIQAFSAAFHTDAHRWLKAIGFKEEGRLQSYGKGGEDFVIFRILKGQQ